MSIMHSLCSKKKAFLFLLCMMLFAAVTMPLHAQSDYYWESPLTITTKDSRFPLVISSETGGSAIIWEEIEAASSSSGKIWLSGQFYEPETFEWKTINRFAGPFDYDGNVPNIYTAAISSAGRIVVTVLADAHTISVYTSDNMGESFSETKLMQSGAELFAPRVFRNGKDEFYLFATEGKEDSFSLMYSTSTTGLSWSDFKSFRPSESVTNPFLPYLVSVPGGDIVVFQGSYTMASHLSYQLYASKQVGSGWTEPVCITGKTILDQTFSSYNNQRANLCLSDDGHLYLAWERTNYASENSQIFVGELSLDGKTLTDIEQLSPNNINASQPVLFNLDGQLCASWYDMRRGVSSVYFARKNGILWSDEAMSSSKINATAGVPVITSDGSLNFVWQQNQTNGQGRIVRLSPDKSVSPPSLIGKTFTAGKRSSATKVGVQVSLPSDSSGIAGYSYSWSQDADELPPYEFMQLSDQTSLSLTATEDGEWYFKVRALDYAGNWSLPATLVYTRDTTPPAKPVIILPSEDSRGYLSSNTFSMKWEAPEDDDVAGYTYNLEYISVLPGLRDEEGNLRITRTPARPASRILTKGKSAAYNNRDNGIYAFSVAAIDEVGNIGEATVVLLAMNKFIPYTTITSVDSSVDDFGTYSLSIIGRGYQEEGLITEIYISRSVTGEPDRILRLLDGDYTITSDRRINGIKVSDLEEGKYRIGLNHEKRGVYWSASALLSAKEFGTVKMGDYTHTFTPVWERLRHTSLFSLNAADILIVFIIVFLAGGLWISARGLVSTAKDGAIINKEVRALIEGDYMPLEKKHQLDAMKHRGISLKYKLLGFTASLCLIVVLLVSVPLGYIMLQNQEETLATGLRQRVEVLLESLSSGVKAYLPSQNVLELSFLPQQSSAVAETDSVTIVGLSGDGSSTGLNSVWATNREDILSAIDTDELSYGQSRITDERITSITELCAVLNDEAVESVADMASGIAELNAEGVTLALKTDADSVARLEEIQSITSQLTQKITTELTSLAEKGAGSYPEWNDMMFDRQNTSYIFYKPVLYRQGSEQNFVRAVVVMEIHTDALLQQLDAEKENIIRVAGVIAVAAIIISLFGSLILASIIIRPVKKLAAHVAMIRDTEDKEELEGKDIKIRARDEIGLLGDTVNDMTHGLIKAAAAAKDLTMGKDLQKMFIPLEADERGRKLTTGKMEDDRAQFFGYYEGAKGVSGDYFDYLKLDDKHYAIIKCDVSGKGVPAALIMVEVATLFLNYFRDWSFKKNGWNLNGIVSQINDLIESRGFKGRFAAFTLCLYNAENGELHCCNAGDNLLHIYEAASGKKKTLVMPETAAAGVFPSFMIDMKGGFKEYILKLQPGDVLFMYTDGIEEAKRMFRNKKYENILCSVEGLKEGDEHETHTVGQESEEMTPERVNAIIEAVFHQQVYTLKKYHSPEENDTFEFDFTNLEPSAEAVIMALVSVEKIFRMYAKPGASELNRVQVDCKVDSFLNAHFRQYNAYCSHRKPHPQLPEYMYYTEVFEDPQYDDLTLIALKRKK